MLSAVAACCYGGRRAGGYGGTMPYADGDTIFVSGVGGATSRALVPVWSSARLSPPLVSAGNRVRIDGQFLRLRSECFAN